jgi:hypothetical protein
VKVGSWVRSGGRDIVEHRHRERVSRGSMITQSMPDLSKIMIGVGLFCERFRSSAEVKPFQSCDASAASAHEAKLVANQQMT